MAQCELKNRQVLKDTIPQIQKKDIIISLPKESPFVIEAIERRNIVPCNIHLVHVIEEAEASEDDLEAVWNGVNMVELLLLICTAKGEVE